jgi:hypothetical protein
MELIWSLDMFDILEYPGEWKYQIMFQSLIQL